MAAADMFQQQVLASAYQPAPITDSGAMPDENVCRKLFSDVEPTELWRGVCQAFTKPGSQTLAPLGCFSEATATPHTEPSLSEVSSSHGNNSPRIVELVVETVEPEKPCRSSPLRWADEPIEVNEDDFCEDFSAAPEPASPSKKKKNRKKKSNGEKAAAPRTGYLLGTPSPSSKSDMHQGMMRSPTGGDASLRSSVTVGDLFGSPCPAQAQGTPGQMAQNETTWFVPVSPCQVQPAAMGITSTSPCATTMNFCYDGFNGYMAAQSSSACMQPYYAAPVSDMNNGWMMNSPVAAVPSPTTSYGSQAGVFSTSPGTQMVTSAPLPVGLVAPSTPVASSPYSTAAPPSNLFSTSPGTPQVASCVLPPRIEQQQQGEAYLMEPAGNPNTDALRSWLQTSGLPSYADLASQLQAAAPEVYED